MNATERRLRRCESVKMSLIDLAHMWLAKHHGPDDASYLLHFFRGDCAHPYRESDGACDLCGG